MSSNTPFKSERRDREERSAAGFRRQLLQLEVRVHGRFAEEVLAHRLGGTRRARRDRVERDGVALHHFREFPRRRRCSTCPVRRRAATIACRARLAARALHLFELDERGVDRGVERRASRRRGRLDRGFDGRHVAREASAARAGRSRCPSRRRDRAARSARAKRDAACWTRPIAPVMLALVSIRMTTSSGRSPGEKNCTCCCTPSSNTANCSALRPDNGLGACVGHRDVQTDQFGGAAEDWLLRDRRHLPHRQENYDGRRPLSRFHWLTAPPCASSAGLIGRKASSGPTIRRINHSLRPRLYSSASGTPRVQSTQRFRPLRLPAAHRRFP